MLPFSLERGLPWSAPLLGVLWGVLWGVSTGHKKNQTPQECIPRNDDDDDDNDHDREGALTCHILANNSNVLEKLQASQRCFLLEAMFSTHLRGENSSSIARASLHSR